MPDGLRRRWTTRVFLVLGLLALLSPGRVDAQLALGTVDGIARVDATGAPIAFSLIRLMTTDSAPRPIQQSITNEAGRFHFDGVPAGTYRLQSRRIGFRPTSSAAFRVDAGAAVRQDLRIQPIPVQLAAVLVRPPGSCLTAADLATDSEMMTVWDEAKKGVETRRAFELRYRFTWTQRQDIVIEQPLRRDAERIRIDTVVNDPDSVVAIEHGVRAWHDSHGYGSRGRLSVPNEKEVFDERFLERFCLETPVRRAGGKLGVQFRMLRQPPRGYGMRGAIWMDSATYFVDRLEYEYLEGRAPTGRVTIMYDDVGVGRSVIRLPSTGDATLDPTGLVMSALVRFVRSRITYAYWGFSEKPPAPVIYARR